MAVIHAPTSPVARCSICGAQRQFHSNNGVPRAHERDHPFVAETIDDFEPGDMDPEQLVTTLANTGNGMRAEECKRELRSQIQKRMGVDWEDIAYALAEWRA